MGGGKGKGKEAETLGASPTVAWLDGRPGEAHVERHCHMPLILATGKGIHWLKGRFFFKRFSEY